MDKNERKKIEERFAKMTSEERDGFHTFSQIILEALSEHHPDAKMLKIHSDLNDEMRNIINTIWFDLPYDKRTEVENEERIKKFTEVMEQFLQICRDFKKENT
jgi:hypothetical protein